MSEEAQAPQSKVKKKPEQKWKPTFQQSHSFESHLFKLEGANMKKKVVLGQNNDTIQEVPHAHFFHTVDSSGKPQEHSVAVGGHFHLVTVNYDPQTGEPKATCSGPMTYGYVKNRKVVIDLPDVGTDERNRPIRDTHTHDVVYQRSSKVVPRTVSVEAVKILDSEASKTKPVEGIKG